MAARQIKPPVQFIPAGGELYDAEGQPVFIDFAPHPVPADQPHVLDDKSLEADPKVPTGERVSLEKPPSQNPASPLSQNPG